MGTATGKGVEEVRRPNAIIGLFHLVNCPKGSVFKVEGTQGLNATDGHLIRSLRAETDLSSTS